MDPYVSGETLKLSAVADDSSGDTVWDTLADAVSRLLDRECEVSDGFFLPAGNSATARSFRAGGTEFIHPDAYVASSITGVTVDGVTSTDYYEKDGYLIFGTDLENRIEVVVTAKWGFSAVPKDIEQACIEQAVYMFRKKDLAFTELSGISTQVATAEFCPTFRAVTKRYREIYSSRSPFF